MELHKPVGVVTAAMLTLSLKTGLQNRMGYIHHLCAVTSPTSNIALLKWHVMCQVLLLLVTQKYVKQQYAYWLWCLVYYYFTWHSYLMSWL